MNPSTIEELQKRAEEARKRLAAMGVNTLTPAPAPKLSLSEILEQQQRKALRMEAPAIVVPSSQDMAKSYLASSLGEVAWNKEQRQAIIFGQQGRSFVLIGAAGTGKTTTLKGLVHTLQVNNLIEPLKSSSKHLVNGAPGIAFVSYTRRAVRQIARQLPKDLAIHAVTIHKLLEFEPVFYEYENEHGEVKKTMRFEPARTRLNPLPRELKRVVIDESSMVANELYEMLKAALPSDCQFIFLGDLHQLPPVYGESVLSRKLQELPIVELTEVYRQALDSPIISIATDIKNGKDIPLKEKSTRLSPDGKSRVVINPWPKQLSSEDALDGLAGTIKAVIKSGNFNEEEDVILMPQYKVKTLRNACGASELNLHIANTLGIQRGAIVHHVIAGFMHWYLAAGDRVLVDKQDCVIREVLRNPKYVGKVPLEPATTLDRWGTYQDEQEHHHLEESDEDMDDLLQRMADTNVEDKVNEASHVLVLESLDSGMEFRVSNVGTFTNMQFSYALTIHKSQGSEWRRVFLFLHSSHHAMCSRELIYTAVTRAREELIIICEPDRRDAVGTLTKAARNPRIKGNTLAEKLAWLKERAKEQMSKEDDELELVGK